MSKITELIRKADAFWEKQDFKQAIYTYISVLEQKPKASLKKKISYCLGMLSFSAGELDSADRFFDESIKLGYRKSESLNYKGIIAKAGKNLALAEELYEKSLLADKKNTYAMNNLANLLSEKGEFAGAESLLVRASWIDAKNPYPRYNLLQLYKSQGKQDTKQLELEYIKISLKQIHLLEENNKPAFGAAADCEDTIIGKYFAAMNTSDHKKSKALLEEVLHESSKVTSPRKEAAEAIGSINVRLGNSLIQLEEWNEAIARYKTASDILGEKESILLNLAVCLKNSGRIDEAASYFAKVSRSKSSSGLAAKCNLAGVAADENVKQSHSLKSPQEYFRLVLESLKRKNFRLIDESKYEVSEAVVEGTNVNESYVFRRAPVSMKSSKVFQAEGKAIDNFHRENEKLGFGLNIIRYAGFIPDVHGYDTIVFSRSRGESMLDVLLDMKRKDDLDGISCLFELLADELVKIRIIGNLCCKDLLSKVHSLDEEKNKVYYQLKVMEKFVGNPGYYGSLQFAAGLHKAEESRIMIGKNYDAVAGMLAGLKEDFYKDVSLKNVLVLRGTLEHIDFETLRNLPFALEVATALSMGDFVRNKDELIKRIFEKNEELSKDLGLSSLGSPEEFAVAVHAAGVQRGLIHHASFTDWKNRLNRQGYDLLAKDCVKSVLFDLQWLKENSSADKEKLLALEYTLSQIYE